MQCKHAFVGVCPEGENTKKEMIDEKIKMETKLTDNVLPVVAPLQQRLRYLLSLTRLCREAMLHLGCDQDRSSPQADTQKVYGHTIANKEDI